MIRHDLYHILMRNNLSNQMKHFTYAKLYFRIQARIFTVRLNKIENKNFRGSIKTSDAQDLNYWSKTCECKQDIFVYILYYNVNNCHNMNIQL